jgi:hypothetical protein
MQETQLHFHYKDQPVIAVLVKQSPFVMRITGKYTSMLCGQMVEF